MIVVVCLGGWVEVYLALEGNVQGKQDLQPRVQHSQAGEERLGIV